MTIDQDALEQLPVAGVLRQAVEASRGGSVVVTAPPGSGKTTLIPAAIVDDLPPSAGLILVQPRRPAARAVAARIAELRRQPLGEEVGYQVRFDRKTSARTRLTVVTPGILLQRLLHDAVLTGIDAVVLDEFHERTVDTDLALGMLLRLRQLRPELRLVVMSATLAADAVARRLDSCPIIHAEGRSYPVQVQFLPQRAKRPLVEQVTHAVAQAAAAGSGHVLVFLPGVGEINRCREALEGFARREHFELMPLYGDLPPAEQDRVLAPCPQRKLILATNVAETSLTIEGVTAVVDCGLARRMTVSPAVGLPRLELVPISQASADQRAGRAGRTAPGVCLRLWDRTTHASRPAEDVPEILRSDFSGPLLRLLAWGEHDISDFPWLDPPPADAVEAARVLLRRLGATDGEGRITEAGRRLAELPAHPRLGRLLLSGARRGVLREAAVTAALLSERDPFRSPTTEHAGPRDQPIVQTRSDAVDRVQALQAFSERKAGDNGLLPHPAGARQILRVAEQLLRLADFPRPDRPDAAPDDDPETALMRALLDAFPDRLARLRDGSRDRGVMVGGRGVRLEAPSRVRGEPLFLAIDLNDAAGDARVRAASAVDRSWLAPDLLRTADRLLFNPTRGAVEARRQVYWQDLLLEETPVEIADAEAAGRLLAEHAAQRLDRVLPEDDAAARFRSRVRWLAAAMPELELPPLDDEQLKQLLPEIAAGARSLDELAKANWLDHLQRAVGYERLAEVDRLAPEQIAVPGGNRHRLDYEPGKPPVLAVRIQEMFGLPDTPRVAGGRVAVLLHLLGPNYRPQQVTSDLASFWKNTYPQVKKELRRRYPKHAWPDDPLQATATRSGLSGNARRR